MSNTDPYKTPKASTGSSETYQPKVFTTQGRIGRLRYLAYGLLNYLYMMIIFGIGGAIFGMANIQDENAMPLIILILVYVPILIFGIILIKRRFNDLNHSGWFSILILIPIINIFAIIYLVFWSGSKEENRFGPPPCENSLAVKIGGLAMPIIAVIGIIAAIALPAYQDYVERVQQAASSAP